MLAQFSLWLCLALHAFIQPVPGPSADLHPPHIPVNLSVLAPESSNATSPRPSSAAFPCLSGIINNYTPVVGFGCDSSTLQVGTLTGFAVGDKVLLLQMQVPQVDLSNTASFGTLLNSTCIGNYEFNRIKSIGGIIQLQYALTRSYDVSGKVQLVRVPEYDSATICAPLTCLPWNGSIGGVLALDVKGQLTFSGDIDVSGKGFRGGVVDQDPTIPWFFGETQYTYPPLSTLSSEKGEGIVMIPVGYSFGRGHAGNGGGGGNAHNGGGGGGGNAGAGGDGGYEIVNLPAPPLTNTNGIGGAKYFENDVNRILLGGGAGSGHANDGRGSSGGAGGGIVFIAANTLQSNNFRILSNGIDVIGGFDQNDGQGGGGAGGTVVLKINQINGILPCELKGGRGGSNPYHAPNQLHGPGGGGSGGKLLLTQNLPGIVPSLQGGINGITSQNLPNGAIPGEFGTLLAGFILPEGTKPIHPVSNQMLLAVQPISCASTNNGQISVLQSTALAFRLNGGSWQSDSVFTSLAAGTYQISLQFSGGCTLDTTATVIANPPLLDTLLALVKPTCTGGGSLTVAAVSGTAPFEFQLNSGGWQQNGVFNNLSAGNYTVTVRDAVGCTHSSAYLLIPPLALRDTLLSLTNVSCLTGGGITVSALGGTLPFEFQINNGPWQSNGTFTNLSPDDYTITLRDGAGCTFTSTHTVAVLPALADTLISFVDAGCTSGGQIVVAATSGTAPFEFQINGGPWQSSGTFANLPQGSYDITIRDAAGCTESSTYVINMAPPALDSLVSLTNAGCVYGGEIVVAPVSGTAPFEFQINSGAWQPTGTFTDLTPGDYTVTMRDAVGCTYASTYTIAAAPPALSSLVALTNAGCIVGGMIVVGPDSGTSPFEFQLDSGTWQESGIFEDVPAGLHTVIMRDAAGCTHLTLYSIAPPASVRDSLVSLTNADCTSGGSILAAAVSGQAPFEFQINGSDWQSNSNFDNLNPGTYTIVLRDAAGCADTSMYVITAPPLAVDSLVSMTVAGCTFGGSISMTAVSGTPPFEFQIDSSAWQTSGVFADLQPGSYTITLRDSVGCMDSSTYIINAPSLLQDSLLVLINAGCTTGGVLAVTAVSGTAPFEFQIDSSAWQSSGVFLDLPAGMHAVAVRDAAGCTQSSTYTIGSPPPVLDSLLVLVPAGCTFGGGLVVTAVSGTAPFTYQMDNGSVQYGGVFWDLPAGSYNVTVRDTVGCSHISTYVIGTPLPVQDSLLALLEASCINPGGVVVGPASGQAPFEFQLNNGAWQDSGVFLDLPAGSYLIALRDAAGCMDTSTYVVAAPVPPLDSLLTLVNPGCTSPGGLAVAAVAGRGPFTFQLNNGLAQESGVFWNLSPGPYTVTLLDAAGCTHVSNYVIAPTPPAQDSLLTLINAGCSFGGEITTDAVSGTAPFEFQLNGGPWQATGNFPDLLPGNYVVMLRDSVGCLDTSTYVIAPPPPPLDSLVSLASATCNLGGVLHVVALSGTAPFEFQINNGPWQSDGNFTNLQPGNYTVTLRDSAGCIDTSRYTVIGRPPVLDSLISLANAGCTVGGTIIAAAISGTEPFEFQLNNGPLQPSGTFTNLQPGTYTVALHDSVGCIHTSTYTVAAPPPVLDSLVFLASPDCREDGQLRVAVVSGTPPFQFQLNGEPWQPDGDFTDLLSGNYVVTVRDSVGCLHNSTYVIAPYEPLALELDYLEIIDCHNPAGSIWVNATGGSGNYNYQLNNSSPQSSGYFPDLAADNYDVIVTDSVGCTAELADLEITVSIDTTLTRETVTIYEGAYFELPDGRRVGQSGQYSFAFQTVEGCDSLHIIDIIVLERNVYVPNIFHPNDDGDNDYLSVFSDASLAVVRRLAIYDRWGEVLFEKRDMRPNVEKQGWDGYFRGRLVDAGVFVWVAELEFVDGLKKTIWGDVTVLR